ncbi:TAXI family TRAP transporter solute-binding subunit [Paucibacter sp. R3-3]|uniref:TAXI family TRAP transporter solute-binding subunit n=1 Tax=Roseateles agri TaxID=3098619 RepID=A0ABU5DIP3_9BURK|nr:TAXI family TRAP transporter solute-binding subunit [Paucibacter sp. R3-3]MDY0746166.1 TAXI family TRAP transporter solute-binding subunit [Paucibacter sp. R3-3]
MTRMPRTFASAWQQLRDLLASIGPLFFLVAALIVGAYWWIDPQPPHTVRMATGPEGSTYALFGKRYAEQLKAKGIEVREIATAGSAENLQLLREDKADVAFIRGGTDEYTDDDALLSLGSLFYEPLWIFYRKLPKAPPITALPQLAKLRLSVDTPGSGVPLLMERLFKANKLDMATLHIENLPPEAATEALLAGKLDAIVLAQAPQSRFVRKLLRAPDIALVDMAQADAYSRRFGFFSSVTLPRGVAELASDLPPQDVSMVALTTALLAREDVHPALRELFADAAVKLHGEVGWFNRARDFPNTRTSELPVSPEGDQAINGTPPFYKRWLPFWLANLVQRMGLLIGGFLVLLLPLSRVIPPLYQWRVRRRVFRWYALLREIEERVETGQETADSAHKRLDQLDERVNRVAVPLSYADELYALRNNIHAARKRIVAREPGPR